MEWTETLTAFEQFLRFQRGFSEHSIRAYLSDLYDYQQTREQQTEIVSAGSYGDLASARAWLADLYQRGLSAATLSRKISALKTFSNWAFDQGRQGSDFAAALQSPKLPRQLPKVLTQPQVERLLEQVCADLVAAQPESLDFAVALRDRAVFELLYASGVRVSELCALNLDSVDLGLRRLRVLGKGNRERVVPFGTVAGQAIAEYLENGRPIFLSVASLPQSGNSNKGKVSSVGALFFGRRGGRLDVRTVRDRLAKACIRAGLPVVGPHGLRHAMATDMLAGGADLRVVQEMLGHASLATTQRYTHVDANRLLAVYEQAFPRS